ncbi:MAG TPA: Uma2 family endonuclease [Planctomycetaceae bacterium]
MATDLTRGAERPVPPGVPPELYDGARMDRETFHRLYQRTPEGFKAELIGGAVHMAAAMRVPHAEHADLLRTWLTVYRFATPRVRGGGDATVLLGEGSEPQPDGLLWVEGGNARIDARGYLAGAPEFVAEVADATAPTDLGPKRDDYERHGVAEYLVLVLPKRRAVWFARDERGGYVETAADADGLLKSRVFPGLWLDAKAFFRLDGNRVLDVLRRGIESPEHARYVESLKA